MSFVSFPPPAQLSRAFRGGRPAGCRGTVLKNIAMTKTRKDASLMKKQNKFFGGEHMNVQENESRRLSQAEMEEEMDGCEAPWLCPKACYEACRGCVRKRKGGRKNATPVSAARAKQPAAPTAMQLRQIEKLAQAAGLIVKPETVTSSDVAERLIFQLALLEARMSGKRWL